MKTGVRAALAAAIVGLGSLLFGGVASAAVTIDQVIANETGLAYNNTYPLDISDVTNLSMQVAYTSTTFASKTFTDGTQSTGSFTVVSFTGLSSATATAQVTITSFTALTGHTLFIAGTNIPFRVASTSSGTACNMASDITTQTIFLSTCSAASVIYSTAPTYGSVYNRFSIQSSSLAAISSATFAGGQDNQTFGIAGLTFTANTDFKPVTSVGVTATNIATAINTSVSSRTLTAQAQGAVVTTTATLNGTTGNFSLASSSNAALSLKALVSSTTAGVATGVMTGGTLPGYTLGSASIAVAAHGFTKALPVLYSGSPAIGGLTTGTTYYAIPTDSGNLQLAATSTGAVAGLGIVVTSSNTATTGHTYTLAPLAVAGTPSFKWQVSNNNTLWNDLTTTQYNVAVGSVTVSSYVAGSTATIWDVGAIGYQRIRLNVTAPTAGGLSLQAYVHGKGR